MAICRRLPPFPDRPCNALGRLKFEDNIHYDEPMVEIRPPWSISWFCESLCLPVLDCSVESELYVGIGLYEFF